MGSCGDLPSQCVLSDLLPDGDDEGSSDHSMGTSPTPIPKIVTTPIQEAEDDSRNEWGKTGQSCYTGA